MTGFGPGVVRASLADQAGGAAGPGVLPGGAAQGCLALALGANLPSAVGDPRATLEALRPLLADTVLAWYRQGWDCPAGVADTAPRLRWSPLFRTRPVGGPGGQPDYLNAVLLLEGPRPPDGPAAQRLLQDLQGLEQRFGRRRRERWGPRSLDLDLLWWGVLVWCSPRLALPHPRWHQRRFVLDPLAALDPALLPVEAVPMLPVGEAPHPLPPSLVWPEGR